MAKQSTFNLRDCCGTCTNFEDDTFVGVRLVNNKPFVSFPLGYAISEEEKDLRRDIRVLLSTLSEFGKKEDSNIAKHIFGKRKAVELPIFAFMDVLDYFIENGGNYYKLVESKYKSNINGKINFKRTIKKETPYIDDDSVKYIKFQIKYRSPLDSALITTIHKYCVQQAFQLVGWLYTSQTIELESITFNKKVFLAEIMKHYQCANKDRDKRLFSSMRSIVEFTDTRTHSSGFYFGTCRFEYVWEELIDNVFGISNKETYFPQGSWRWRNGFNPNNKLTVVNKHKLMPDTIMKYNDKIYILDAKFYKYGITNNSFDLPDTSSIGKQIIYGQYVKDKTGIDDTKLFNAFLMPFNCKENPFGVKDEMVKMGEAVISVDKENRVPNNYERIQGILIDVKSLMVRHNGDKELKKNQLALLIEKQ